MTRRSALLVAVALGACSNDRPGSPINSPVAAPAKDRAEFAVVVTVMRPGGVDHPIWPVTVTVDVWETAGIGAYIEALVTTIHRGQVSVSYPVMPGTRIPPGGQGRAQQVLQAPRGWETAAPEGPIDIDLRLRDDLGNVTEVTNHSGLR